MCKKTSRYITTDTPDKAIDALDEVGSRVHLITSFLKRFLTLRKKLKELRKKKLELLDLRGEEAAKLRDTERNLNERLELAKKWEEEQEYESYSN